MHFCCKYGHYYDQFGSLHHTPAQMIFSQYTLIQHHYDYQQCAE